MGWGDDFPEIEHGVTETGYIEHINRKGEEVKKTYRAKPWVVARIAS